MSKAYRVGEPVGAAPDNFEQGSIESAVRIDKIVRWAQNAAHFVLRNKCDAQKVLCKKFPCKEKISVQRNRAYDKKLRATVSQRVDQ